MINFNRVDYQIKCRNCGIELAALPDMSSMSLVIKKCYKCTKQTGHDLMTHYDDFLKVPFSSASCKFMLIDP